MPRFGARGTFCAKPAYAKYERLRVLVSCAQYADARRWLHVSVSLRGGQLPSWPQMSEVKELFIGGDRQAIQVMPPRSNHVNIHEVLHLWHCLDGDGLPDFTGGGETI